MSKISKFKSHITADEASALLSELIGEKVSAEDIRNLHKEGWLYAHYECSATLVKVRQQNSLVREETEVCLCFGFDHPLGDTYVNDEHLSFALYDLEGSEYAIRDIDTDQYINRKNYQQLCIAEPQYYPKEIYEVSVLANNGLAVEHPGIKNIRNYDCCSTFEIYNFKPDSEHTLSRVPPNIDQQQSDPPSYVLAVAALVEIATNGGNRNHNQTSLISEILDKYELRGLSKSNLEKIFSQAKRRLSEAKAAKS